MSIANWNEAQVSDWLKIVGLDEYCDLFFGTIHFCYFPFVTYLIK